MKPFIFLNHLKDNDDDLDRSNMLIEPDLLPMNVENDGDMGDVNTLNEQQPNFPPMDDDEAIGEAIGDAGEAFDEEANVCDF